MPKCKLEKKIKTIHLEENYDKVNCCLYNLCNFNKCNKIVLRCKNVKNFCIQNIMVVLSIECKTKFSITSLTLIRKLSKICALYLVLTIKI